MKIVCLSSIDKDFSIMQPTRRALFFVLKLMFTGIILWVLYYHSQLEFRLLYTFLEHPLAALLIVALCYLMVLFHAGRWHILNAAQNIQLSFSRTVLPTFVGIAFNNVLPGSVGGDFFRLYYVLKKFPRQKSKTILSIFVDRVMGLLGTLVLACLVAPYYLDSIWCNATLYYLMMVCVSVCIASLILFLAMVMLLTDKTGFATKIKRLLMKMNFASRFLPVLDAIHDYRNSKIAIFLSLLMSIGTQLLLLAVVSVIGRVMGLPELPLGVYMLALVIGQIANLIPLTPGGLGVGEAAFANIIYLLHPGTVAAYATAFFALRLLSTLAYLPGVIIGVFAGKLIKINEVEFVSEGVVR